MIGPRHPRPLSLSLRAARGEGARRACPKSLPEELARRACPKSLPEEPAPDLIRGRVRGALVGGPSGPMTADMYSDRA